MIAKILLLVCMCSCLLGYSQKITGKILDNDGAAVVAGNVIVVNLADSATINGVSFWDGSFEITVAEPKGKGLRIVAMGFVDQVIPIKDIKNNQLEVKLQAAEMETFDFVALKPTFKNEGDRVIVNVEESSLSNSGNALDVLRKSPGVNVNSKDQVNIFGKGNPTLYLDGQPITAEMLKGIPSTSIKEVEVIKEPSAKYDAEGRAVINIVSKKSLEGYHVSLSSNTTHAVEWQNYSGGRLTYKKGKLNMMGRFGTWQGKGWDQDTYNRTFEEGGVPITMDNELITTQEIPYVHFFGGAVSYELDSLHKIGASFNGSTGKWVNRVANTNRVKIGSDQFDINTNTTGSVVHGDNVANLNHTWTLDTNRSELVTAAQYTGYYHTSNDDIDETISSGDEISKRNNGSNFINILTARTDLVKHLNKKTKFEAGLKYANVFNSSDISFDRKSGSAWVNSDGQSNNFDYDEKISAGYFQYYNSGKKFDFRAGVRGEWTKSYGFSNWQNAVVVDTSYINLFPNAKLTWHMAEDWDLVLGYAYRINRPNYQDLDPFVDYIDSLSIERGNPRLMPEYTHEVKSSLVFMEYASLDFEYANTRNAMNMVVRRNPGSNRFEMTTTNYDFSEVYTVGLGLPYETKMWTTYNGFGIMRSIFQFDMADESVVVDAPMWYVYLYDEFRIPKICNLELTLEYYSDGVDGMFSFNSFWQFNISASRKFFKDKLTVRASVNDLFWTVKEEGDSFVPGYDIHYLSRSATQQFQVGLSYNFGKLSDPSMKVRRMQSDEGERIKSEK